MQLRGDSYKFALMPIDRKLTQKSINDEVVKVNMLMNNYRSTVTGDAGEAALMAFDSDWAEYQSALTEAMGFAKDKKQESLNATYMSGGRLSDACKALSDDLNVLLSLNLAQAKKMDNQGDASFLTTWVTILAVELTALSLAILIGFWLVSSINHPLKIMTNALLKLQNGVISHDTDEKTKEKLLARKDEFGKAITALVHTEEYMVSMTDVADSIASNDLTVEFAPKSDQDQLGNAFKKMILGLRKTIGEVADSALNVSSAATQLSSVANEAGQATIADRNHHPAGRPGYCPAVRIRQQDRFLRRTDDPRHRWRCPRRPGTGWSHQ